MFVSISYREGTTTFRDLRVSLRIINVYSHRNVSLFFCVPFRFRFQYFTFLEEDGKECYKVKDSLYGGPIVNFFYQSSNSRTRVLINIYITISITTMQVTSGLLLMFPGSSLNYRLVIVLISSKGERHHAKFPTVSHDRNSPPPYFNEGRIRMLTINPTFQGVNVFQDVMEGPTLRAMGLITSPIEVHRRVIPMDVTPKANICVSNSIYVMNGVNMEHQNTMIIPVETRVLITRPKTYHLSSERNGDLDQGGPRGTYRAGRGHRRLTGTTTSNCSVFRRGVLAFVGSGEATLFTILIIGVVLKGVFQFPMYLVQIGTFTVAIVLGFHVILNLLFQARSFCVMASPTSHGWNDGSGRSHTSTTNFFLQLFQFYQFFDFHQLFFSFTTVWIVFTSQATDVGLSYLAFFYTITTFFLKGRTRTTVILFYGHRRIKLYSTIWRMSVIVFPFPISRRVGSVTHIHDSNMGLLFPVHATSIILCHSNTFQNGYAFQSHEDVFLLSNAIV